MSSQPVISNPSLNSRLAQITTQDSISALQRGDVVHVLKEPMGRPDYRVFLRRDKASVPGGETMTFYSPLGSLRPSVISEWTTARAWLHPDNSGVMQAEACAYEHRKMIVPGDAGYDTLRADLSSLGLM